MNDGNGGHRGRAKCVTSRWKIQAFISCVSRAGICSGEWYLIKREKERER